MEKRDYKNYDYLGVTIKKDVAEYLESFYLALGYEIIEVEEHSRYVNEVNVTFRRPHKIRNKDKLQLLQIHVETLLNSLGKYSETRRTYSVVFGILTGLASVALIVLGLIIAFAFSEPILGDVSFIWGVSASVTGGVCLLIFALLTFLISNREGEYRKIKSDEIREELGVVIKSAFPLLDNEDKANAAQYAENKGLKRGLDE